MAREYIYGEATSEIVDSRMTHWCTLEKWTEIKIKHKRKMYTNCWLKKKHSIHYLHAVYALQLAHNNFGLILLLIIPLVSEWDLKLPVRFEIEAGICSKDWPSKHDRCLTIVLLLLFLLTQRIIRFVYSLLHFFQIGNNWAVHLAKRMGSGEKWGTKSFFLL